MTPHRWRCCGASVKSFKCCGTVDMSHHIIEWEWECVLCDEKVITVKEAFGPITVPRIPTEPTHFECDENKWCEALAISRVHNT